MNTVHGKELGWILLRDRKKTYIYIRIHHPHDFGFIALLFKNPHCGERDSGAPRAREARARGRSPIAK